MLIFNINLLFNTIKNFLKFYFNATTLYNVHSPFVYNLVSFIFKNKLPEDFKSNIQIVRRQLKTSEVEIPVRDFGAGSKNTKKDKFDKVSRISKTSVSGPLKSLWLYNINVYFHPDNVLELGTSLGLSAAHLAQNAGNVKTLEGNPAIANTAHDVFKNLNITNVEIITGNFDDTLKNVLEHKSPPDLVYLDGNHTYEATIRYFDQLKTARNDKEMILIFDDIYWSEGMMKAWKEIKAQVEVSLSIDIYFFGLIFFKTNTIAPKHYILLPGNWKPWHIGFKPVK